MLSDILFYKMFNLINMSTVGSSFEDPEGLEELYSIFKNYPDSAFESGIKTMLKTEKDSFAPSIGKIVYYIEKEMFFGMSKEDFLSLLRTYRATNGNIVFSDSGLNKLLKRIDIEESLRTIRYNNKITYLENKKRG